MDFKGRKDMFMVTEPQTLKGVGNRRPAPAFGNDLIGPLASRNFSLSPLSGRCMEKGWRGFSQSKSVLCAPGMLAIPGRCKCRTVS